MLELKQEFNRLSTETRLYQTRVPLIGLTGGIGTGKSTVSTLLRKFSIPVIDADKLVKEIYQDRDFHHFLNSIFPEIDSHKIDFKLLRNLVFNSPERKKKLEYEIQHRLPAKFNSEINTTNAPYYIYDVPLLFERQLETKLDATVLVYAPKEIQLKRALTRDHEHDPDSIKKIIEHQFDIETKKTRSEFIVDNSKDLLHLEKQVEQMLDYFFGLTR